MLKYLNLLDLMLEMLVLVDRLTIKKNCSATVMACVLETCDLDTYVDAQGVPEWETAVTAKMNSLKKNQTWELVPRPQGNNVVKCRWVYKTSFNFDSVVECQKDRLVAKGFSYQEGIDYIESFSHVVKMNLVRLNLSLDSFFWTGTS